MKNSSEGVPILPAAPMNPRADESGPRPVPQRPPNQEDTRRIDGAALVHIYRERDKRIAPTPTEETAVYSREGLSSRLDTYRTTRIRGDIDEIEKTYAASQGAEQARKIEIPEKVTRIVQKTIPPPIPLPGRTNMAEAIRREHEEALKSRERYADLVVAQEAGALRRKIEAARPSINPRFGNELPSFNRPRVVVTGIPPAPLRLAKLMERSLAEIEEIEDLTEFAEYVEPEIEQTPTERKTNTVIFARNENTPSPSESNRPADHLPRRMTSQEVRDREQGIPYEQRARIEAAKIQIQQSRRAQEERPNT